MALVIVILGLVAWGAYVAFQVVGAPWWVRRPLPRITHTAHPERTTVNPISPYVPVPEAKPTQGKSIASLVLGILAVIPMSWIYVFPALVMGILAIVFGKDTRRSNGMAKAGWVMGIVAVSLAGVVLSLVVIALIVSANQSQGY